MQCSTCCTLPSIFLFYADVHNCNNCNDGTSLPHRLVKGYNASDFLLFRRTVASYAAHNRSTGIPNIYGLYNYHSHVPKWDLCDSQDFPVTSDVRARVLECCVLECCVLECCVIECGVLERGIL